MLATFGSSITGAVGPMLGPWPFVVLTFGMLRAGTDEGDALSVATFTADGLWRIDDDGTEWTDVTIHLSTEV